MLWVFVLGPSLWAEAGCWRCAGCLVYMLIAGVLLGQRGLPCVAAQVAHRKGIDPGRLALLTAYDAKIAAIGKIAAATAAASRDQAGHQHKPRPDARP